MTGRLEPGVAVTDSEVTRLSREVLGEGYLVGIVVVLNGIIFTEALATGTAVLPWILVWIAPGLILLGVVYWLRAANLPGDEIWDVAKYTALGVGFGSVLLFILTVSNGLQSMTGTGTFRFGATVLTLAMVGVFAGTTRAVYRSNQSLGLRNRVLRRVLRHDLRNDMTVVLVTLDDLESELGGEQRAKVSQAKEKVKNVVDLTDKVRRVDVATQDSARPVPVDLVAIIEKRIDVVASTHPAATIETTLPKTAGAWADTDFGMVIDSVVESAVSSADATPHLQVGLQVESDVVTVTIEDNNETIPKSDLTAVSSESETALRHARGVELWLIRWLVEASNGDLHIDETRRRIEITLDRAADRGGRWRRLRLLFDQLPR